MKIGQKHLITCKCVLPQYRKMAEPPQHKFVVFSVINDDKVIQKYVQCQNCGAVHKVFDICTSEIIKNKDDLPAVITKDDCKAFLPQNLSAILETSDVDIATWEAASFIIENKQWGDFIVLSKDDMGDEKQIKIVKILSENMFKTEIISRSEFIQ